MTKQREYESEPPTPECAGQDETAERRYTLEPLRRLGAAALVCTDVEGIEAVRLKEVRFLWGGLGNEIEMRKSDDLFASLKRRGRTLPAQPEIIRAIFGVKFSGPGAQRTLVIRPNEGIELTRDEDRPVIERWLEARGFVERGAGDDETTVASLDRN